MNTISQMSRCIPVNRLAMALAVAVSFFLTMRAAAFHQSSNPIEGTIASVDLSHHGVTISPSDGSRALVLEVNYHTEVRRGDTSVPVTALARGQAVRGGYFAPIFGPAYLGRLTIIPPTKPKHEPSAAPRTAHQFKRRQKP